MNNFNHRVGVSEENLVNRKLRLTGINQRNHASIYEELNMQFGIEKINIGMLSDMLNVSYDATHINLIKIENILEKHKVKIYKSWWNSTKKSYYQFVDQNIIDQKSHQEVSCHKASISPKKSNK